MTSHDLDALERLIDDAHDELTGDKFGVQSIQEIVDALPLLIQRLRVAEETLDLSTKGHLLEIQHWRGLLKKYINHVVDEEGVSFVGLHFRSPAFTEEEWRELTILDDEALADSRLAALNKKPYRASDREYDREVGKGQREP